MANAPVAVPAIPSLTLDATDMYILSTLDHYRQCVELDQNSDRRLLPYLKEMRDEIIGWRNANETLISAPVLPDGFTHAANVSGGATVVPDATVQGVVSQDVITIAPEPVVTPAEAIAPNSAAA